MIDAHIHLEQYNSMELEEAIKVWQEAGVRGVVAVSNNLKSSYQTLELQTKYSPFVHACVGFHPEQELPNLAEWNEWNNLIKGERKRISGIGEIGLPHYALDTLKQPFEEYIIFLRECLQVAKLFDLPVVLHAVHDKANLALNLLKEEKITMAHFHWLKAEAAVVKDIIDQGYYISVTPEICYRERDKQLARIIPLQQLLIETDGPWQYNSHFRLVQTTPLLLNDIIQRLTGIKNIKAAALEKQIVENTQKCYKLYRKEEENDV